MGNTESEYSQQYTQGGGFGVLVEWDGYKPPTRWYDRLRALGYKVSGSKDKSPLARRESAHHNGLVFQEGALLCREESEARTLAYLARECGAVNAMVMAYTACSTELMSEEDSAALGRVQSVLSRRGRPPKATPTIINCLDCGRASANSGAGFRCEHCGGTNITQHDGERVAVKLPADSYGTLEGYVASRMFTGVFEEPDLRGKDDTEANLLDTNIPLPDSLNIIITTEAYQHARDAYLSGLISWVQFYRMLDIIRLTLGRTNERRVQSRINAIQKFIRMGGDATKLMLAILSPNAVDLMDCAGATSDDLPWKMIRHNYKFSM